jgi:hypothetical protein
MSNFLKSRFGRDVENLLYNPTQHTEFDHLSMDEKKRLFLRFTEYWTEKVPGTDKMRFEMQKDFDLREILKSWATPIDVLFESESDTNTDLKKDLEEARKEKQEAIARLTKFQKLYDTKLHAVHMLLKPLSLDGIPYTHRERQLLVNAILFEIKQLIRDNEGIDKDIELPF